MNKALSPAAPVPLPVRKAQTLVAALFDNVSDAERAVRGLCQAGFVLGQIGAAIPQKHNLAAFDALCSRASANVGSDGGCRLVNLLGRGQVAYTRIQGVGPLVIAGSLVPVLAAPLHPVSRWSGDWDIDLTALARAGLDEAQARYVRTGLAAGKVLLAVSVQNRHGNAGSILRRHGGRINGSSLDAVLYSTPGWVHHYA